LAVRGWGRQKQTEQTEAHDDLTRMFKNDAGVLNLNGDSLL
jgi:hypothetical protein